MIQKYIDELLEVSTVKEGDNFSLGRYEGRVPHYGLYLRPVKNSVLERIEKKARLKFQLEEDAENYSQEARVIFFQKMKEYMVEKGCPTNEKEKNDMFGYLYNACNNSLTNLARWSKSNRSVYDEEANEFSIVQLLSMDNDNESLPILEKEVEDKLTEINSKSFSYFRIWFNENKDKILTKKQLAYLEDEQSVGLKNRSKINRTISERIYRNYTDESIIKHRISKIKHRKEVLEDVILHSKTDRQLIHKIVNKMKKETWLLESVYSLSFDTCSMVTKACKDIEYDCNSDCAIEIREELQRLYDYISRVLEGLEKKL